MDAMTGHKLGTANYMLDVLLDDINKKAKPTNTYLKMRKLLKEFKET